jgi:hypothetical protein
MAKVTAIISGVLALGQAADDTVEAAASATSRGAVVAMYRGQAEALTPRFKDDEGTLGPQAATGLTRPAASIARTSKVAEVPPPSPRTTHGLVHKRQVASVTREE